MTRYETLVIGLAAVLAALGYLVRQVARLATAVRWVAAHPAEHRRLAIEMRALTEQLRQLTAEITQARTPGRRGRPG